MFTLLFAVFISVTDYVGSILSYFIIAIALFAGKYDELSVTELGGQISRVCELLQLADYNIRLQKEYLISKANLSDTPVGQLPNKSFLIFASEILVIKTRSTAVSHSLYRLL